MNPTATTSDEEQAPTPNVACHSDMGECPEPAVLTAIAHIDHNDFWLMSDGGYQGPGSVWKDILDVKPLCALTKPSLEPLDSDFATMLSTFCLLMQNCITAGYGLGKSLFGNDNLNPTRFKLRHCLSPLTPIWTMRVLNRYLLQILSHLNCGL
ncbi:hypothetical protein EDD15DRAFT_2200065 [Pisolithus albus]|nr:hypothetical protein EDD15DRAFT_2200065 [Pisolithus albus]